MSDTDATAARLRPDVVLMGIRMPVLDGIAAIRQIHQAHTTGNVIILTTIDLDQYVYDALEAVASGFLLKDVKAEVLADAVRTIHGGDALLAPAVTRRLIERTVSQREVVTTAPGAVATLTAREREVLVLIARGFSNADIAGGLFSSRATVKTHVGRISAELGVRDRAQAVILAYNSGL
ncbi:MAG: response regulator transcription factor [Marmoricola sp.]|nr:response regulator transcription factor [Marmoricola sp.]